MLQHLKAASLPLGIGRTKYRADIHVPVMLRGTSWTWTRINQVQKALGNQHIWKGMDELVKMSE